jgi:hypothetical protein
LFQRPADRPGLYQENVASTRFSSWRSRIIPDFVNFLPGRGERLVAIERFAAALHHLRHRNRAG